MPTAISDLSKPDTILLLDATAGDLFVDLSQNRTNLTDNTTYFDEATSARAAIDAPREVAVVVDMRTGDDGVLVELGDAGGYSWRVRLSGSGLIEVAEGGLLLASVEPPGLAAGAQTYLVHWSQHPVEGGSVRSELAVYNFDAPEWAHAQQTHIAGTADATDTLTVCAAYGGATPFSGGVAAFTAVRIGRRHHSGCEAAEDWIATASPPSTTQTRRTAPIIPDRATLDIADDGSFCGPAHLWGGHAFEQADRRLVSPLVNLRIRDPLQIRDDSPSSATQNSWWRKAPGSSTMYLALPYLFYRARPGKVNRVRARVYVRQTIEIGTETAEVRYRLYSIAGLPVVGEPVPALTYRRSAQATCDVNHGSTAGGGEWLDLGDMSIETDSWGCTWLALGIEFDLDSPLSGDTRAYVHALTVEPFALSQGDGLDIALP